MSPFRSDSEIWQFNRTATTDWQSLSAETCEVTREALRIAALTSDAFNPTVGPIVGQFGFGPIKGTATGQSRDIAVEDGRLRKRKPDLSIDLCGIAKGYALDRMAFRQNTLIPVAGSAISGFGGVSETAPCRSGTQHENDGQKHQYPKATTSACCLT